MGIDGWALYFAGLSPEKPDALATARASVVSIQVPDRLASQEKKLARPRANAKLPMSWRLREVVGWLNADAECAVVSRAEWKPLSAGDEMVLRVFAEALLRKKSSAAFPAK